MSPSIDLKTIGEACIETEHDEGKSHDNSKIDKELAQYVSDVRITISPERNKELLWKIDRLIMPISIFTCLMQAFTQSSLSFASVMGLPQDIGLITSRGTVSQEYSWLATSLNLAVLVAEYPQNFIITRVPIAKYLGFCLMVQGVLVAAQAACDDFAGMVTCRVLVGVFEAACQPSLILITSMWYKREEQTARVTLWYMMAGGQQVFGGILSYGFIFITSGPLAAWKWWFLFLGILTLLCGAIIIIWLPDSPMRARGFTVEERRELIERTRDNQTGIQNRTFKWKQAVEAFGDPQIWSYSLISLCTTLPTAGLASFANIIIHGFGFSVQNTELLSMPFGLVIVLILLSSIWLVNKTKQNILVMLVYLLPSFVCTALLMTLPERTLGDRIGLLICFYFAFGFWAVQSITLSMVSRNVAGQTKKLVAVAANFVMWAAGNCIGPQVFLAWDGPRYYIAFATHLGCYSLLVIILFGLRWYLKRQNTIRDRMAASGTAWAAAGDTSRAWDDLTDKENLSFRYHY